MADVSVFFPDECRDRIFAQFRICTIVFIPSRKTVCLGNRHDTFAVNAFAALSGHVLHPYNDSELHYTPSTVVLQWNATGKSNSEN